MSQNEEKSDLKVRRPFFIATTEKGGVYSERIVGLEPLDDFSTRIVTTGYGEYSYKPHVQAPLEVVAQILEEHGYDWVSEDELKIRTENLRKPSP